MSRHYKARLKATGEIIEVKFNDGWIRWTEPKCWLNRNEFEILEEIPNEPISDSDLRISVAKLREVLESIADGNGFLCEDIDVIIEKVKSEL